MAASRFISQIATQTITASGSSAAFPLPQDLNALLAEVEIAAAPTGTSPTVTFQLYVSEDGSVFEPFGSATSSLNAVGVTALSNSNVVGFFGKIFWVIGGSASPTFTLVTINIYAS